MALLNPVDRPLVHQLSRRRLTGQITGLPVVSLISDEFEHSPTPHTSIKSLTVCVPQALPPQVA
jgi:hypothetical protein